MPAVLNPNTHKQVSPLHRCRMCLYVCTVLVVRFRGKTEISPTPRSQQVRGRQTLERSRPQRGPFRSPAILRACGGQRQLPPAPPLPPPPRGVHGEAERREVGGPTARERHLERARALEPPDRRRQSGDHFLLPVLLVLVRWRWQQQRQQQLLSGRPWRGGVLQYLPGEGSRQQFSSVVSRLRRAGDRRSRRRRWF